MKFARFSEVVLIFHVQYSNYTMHKNWLLVKCLYVALCFIHEWVFPRQNYTKNMNPLNYCLQYRPEKYSPLNLTMAIKNECKEKVIQAKINGNSYLCKTFAIPFYNSELKSFPDRSTNM